jgi:hypothetical protein
MRQLVPHYGLPEPRDITNDWPRLELDRLRTRFKDCLSAISRWEYGIVYAIRLDETFLPELSDGAGGIFCRVRIPPDRLVAKAIIPREAAIAFDQLNCHQNLEYCDLPPYSILAPMNPLF